MPDCSRSDCKKKDLNKNLPTLWKLNLRRKCPIAADPTARRKTKISLFTVLWKSDHRKKCQLQQIRLQEVISVTITLIVIRRPDEIHPCSKEEFQSSKINQKGKGRVRQEGRSNGKLSIANRRFASSQISERVIKNFRETCSYDLVVSCSFDHTDSCFIITRTCYEFSLPRRSNNQPQDFDFVVNLH